MEVLCIIIAAVLLAICYNLYHLREKLERTQKEIVSELASICRLLEEIARKSYAPVNTLQGFAARLWVGSSLTRHLEELRSNGKFT